MVEIDPTLTRYVVRFKEKTKRKNQRDDKFEIVRHEAGIADTNNYQDLVKESLKTAHSEYKNNPYLIKDHQTIVDINLFETPQVHIKLTAEQAAVLRRHEDIRYVEPVKYRKTCAEIIPWGITRVQGGSAVNSTKYHKGAGVRCAVVDTGCDFTHVDLAPNYKGGMTAVAGTTTPQDDFNPEYHGTHVAGILLAAANNAGVVGVACEAWLYAVKAGDLHGSFTNADVVEAYTWCNANNMQVVNSSFAGAGFDQGESDAVHAGFLNNEYYGCASNNTGTNAPTYPASYANAWCTGSVDKADTISSFSTWGPVGYVDFVGPGGGNGLGDITSDMPGNRLQDLPGTSMATPHICGIAALGFANYRFSPCDTITYAPTQTKIIQIVGAMISSCDTLGKTTPGVQNDHYGFGMPQASKMMQLLAGV